METKQNAEYAPYRQLESQTSTDTKTYLSHMINMGMHPMSDITNYFPQA
jgi:hypothetical protein